MHDYAAVFAVDRLPSDGADHIPGVYLSTDLYSRTWPEHLRLVLNTERARSKWSHGPRLLRILVSEMFAEVGNTSLIPREDAGGISSGLPWDENDCHTVREIIVLDIPRGNVAFAEPGTERRSENWYGHMNFAEYCDQIAAQYPEIWA